MEELKLSKTWESLRLLYAVQCLLWKTVFSCFTIVTDEQCYLFFLLIDRFVRQRSTSDTISLVTL